MRLIRYFLKDVPDDAVLTERHRQLLEMQLFHERRMDRFLQGVDIPRFMSAIPRYHKGGLHR